MLRLAEAAELFKDRVYAECWICAGEFVVGRGTKREVKQHELGGHFICANCRVVLNGRAYSRGKLDWARRFVQMHIALTKLVRFGEQGMDADEEEIRTHLDKIAKLLEEINAERPRRRLYRKTRTVHEA